MKDAGDKISEEDKTKLNSAIEEAKKDFASDDLETVKKALEKLQTESQEVMTKLYQNASAQGASGAEGADASSEGAQGGENINVDPNDVKVD